MSSNGTESLSSTCAGVLPPSSASLASNHGVEPPRLPPQLTLTTPTGTTPSARRLSESLVPRQTIRFGSRSIVVEPNACSIVTGKAPGSTAVASFGVGSVAVVDPVLQAESTPTAPTASDENRKVRRSTADL